MSSCNKDCICKEDDGFIIENNSFIQKLDSSSVWENLSLPNLKTIDGEAYRLMILPSYECEKRVSTITQNDQKAFLKISFYNSTDNQRRTDTLQRDIKYELSKKEFLELKKSFDYHCYWSMKASSDPTLDGVGYFLEAKKVQIDSCSKNDYHAVVRNKLDISFSKLCNQILELAESSLQEQESINNQCWH